MSTIHFPAYRLSSPQLRHRSCHQTAQRRERGSGPLMTVLSVRAMRSEIMMAVSDIYYRLGLRCAWRLRRSSHLLAIRGLPGHLPGGLGEEGMVCCKRPVYSWCTRRSKDDLLLDACLSLRSVVASAWEQYAKRFLVWSNNQAVCLRHPFPLHDQLGPWRASCDPSPAVCAVVRCRTYCSPPPPRLQ